MKTYSFKLYKSKRNRKLHKQINAAGLIYNHCIALHKRYYRLFSKSLNMYQLQKHLTKLKKIAKFGYLKEIGSQAVQDITQRIDRAYKLFYRNLEHKIRTAPPSFKKVAKYKSYTLKQAGWKLDEDNRSITIGKERYKYFKSRSISGTVKTVTIKRDTLGDIYVYFVCDVQENEVLARMGKSIGFDFGYDTFLIAPNKTDNVKSPKFFRKNANAIKRVNRILARKLKGSNNFKRAKLALARLHKKSVNQRRAFHWDTAYDLVGKYALIGLEDLNMKFQQRGHGKGVLEAGFGDFVKILKYVASKTGSSVVQVDRFYPSSQLCHVCGYKNPITKNQWIREYDCPVCGTHHNRDVNAAINIERESKKIFFSA